MNRTKLIVMAVLFANLLLITATLVGAQTPVNINFGTALPDGIEGEWNTKTGPSNPDWVAYTCAPGVTCTNGNATGDLFMRFDANAPATSGNPNHGTLFILWIARGTYNPDPQPCGKSGGPACNNWVQFRFLSGTWATWVEDSATFLYPGVTYTPVPHDVWAQLNDHLGWEAATIEWPCDPPYTRAWNFQGMVNNAPSTSGPLDITFTCTSIDSTHGATGPAMSITNDSVTISSTLPITASGTVTWYYCYDGATTIPPSSTFPNGCLPNDPLLRFVTTPIGSRTLKLYTAPSPIQVALNLHRGDAIPIQLGPELAPSNVFTATNQVTYLSPNFTPTQIGTYCYYAVYVPSGPATAAGYATMSHTNNSTECFIVTLPTAVSISSMTAQVNWPSANLPLLVGLWVGAVAMIGAGVVGIGKLLRKL